ANIVRGMAIDETMTYTGTFFDLLNPYSLVGGLVTLSLFVLHGALFLEMKTDGDIRARVQAIARPTWFITTGLIVAFVLFSFVDTDMFTETNIIQIVALVVAVGALLYAGFNLFRSHFGLAFIGSGLTIVGVVVLLFSSLFPNVMPS
ncbi:MAG TPA: cytochrome d ubiquinol oxidase subunit II, partial [Aggregatilineales bacterium]|nr:cytochrome d ubiquinol oxidase subunit II [Aggregatilineales bacterium]